MKKTSGYIDHLSHRTVQGWAWDAAAPQRRLLVEITDPKGRTILTRANLFRKDLKAENVGDGSYGFSVTFPDDISFEEQSASGFSAKISGTSCRLRNQIGIQNSNPLIEKTAHLFNRAIGMLASTSQSPSFSPNTLPVLHSESATLAYSFGKILAITGGRIDVSIVSETDTCIPMVFVGRKPAWRDHETTKPTDQPHVREHRFYVSGINAGDEISLWIISDGQINLCEVRKTAESSFERAVLSQMTRAALVAKQPGAVAITCWDGGHNPIGRAKVLYDVLQGKRPTVLFCFLFQDFGGDIWPPLANTYDNIVTIPWSNRHHYLHIAQGMGLQFDTVWMCKPRAPTFQLAAHIARPDAKLVLDLDDNEEHFSRSKGSRFKAYGMSSIGLSRFVMAEVPARTAASGSLVEDFNAILVRHARQDATQSPKTKSPRTVRPKNSLRIGFIGTVRPHKRILEAAQQINRINEASDNQFEFHVYGDVQPAKLQADLEAIGVVVKQNIPASHLSDHLRQMDIILSGFPSEAQADEPITKYQISAKVGDALSVGRPVLVPNGPSVSDLEKTSGVFLFSPDKFEEQLLAAADMRRSTTIALPDSFTMEAAYRGFQQAETVAATAKRGAEALALVPRNQSMSPLNLADTPTLLLIWKQHDGGLYGRRLDMICRAYRTVYPEHRVVVLELIYPDFDGLYRQEMSGLSEFAYINEMNIRKQHGNMSDQDGTEYKQLLIDKSLTINEKLLKFLSSHEILPTNSVIVLFPNIMHLERVFDLIHPYPLLTDVVDNQLGWASDAGKLKIIEQYFTLAKMSDRVVFNSAMNHQYFQDKGFFSHGANNASIIPNWYQLPEHVRNSISSGDTVAPKQFFDIVYSGNMNDRIDWKLLAEITALDDTLRLHLIGEARRSQDEILEMLERPNVIFHGPMTEEMTLQILASADLTVMPHVVDDVSTYMNPLKVHMYAAMGLQTISTDIPGIEASENLHICDTPESFLAAVRKAIGDRSTASLHHRQTAELTENAQSYVTLIDSLREIGPHA